MLASNYMRVLGRVRRFYADSNDNSAADHDFGGSPNQPSLSERHTVVPAIHRPWAKNQQWIPHTFYPDIRGNDLAYHLRKSEHAITKISARSLHSTFSRSLFQMEGKKKIAESKIF